MAEQNQTPELSNALRKQIEALRKPFGEYAADFAKVYQRRKDLAPQFMSAFGAWMSEIGAGASFVNFVRLLDPTVPADRNGYKEHPSYQAADYMRRLVSRRDTGGNASRPTRSPGLTNLARLLKTVLPLYLDPETFWRGIAGELGLKPRQVTNLRTAVDEVEPLLELPKIKPMETAKIIHMPTRTEQRETAAAAAPAAEAEPMGTGTARRTRKRAA